MGVNHECADLLRRLEACADADLPGFAREEAVPLESCRACRAELALRDPSVLFALLALETKEEAFFAGFETRVMAGVREAQRETRGGWLGSVLRPRFLALAAAVAALGIVLVARQRPLGPGPAEKPETRASVPLAPESPEAGSAGAALAGSDLRPILERDAAAPSPVESVASATARVISIQVAGPQQEPSDLVLIVDPEMPL